MKKNLFLMTISLLLLSLALTAQVKKSVAKPPTNVKSTTVVKKKATSSNSKFGTFTDPRDGRVYKTVRIGSQVWMAENLAYGQPSKGCSDYNALYVRSRSINNNSDYLEFIYDIYACGEKVNTIRVTASLTGSDWTIKNEYYNLKFSIWDRANYKSYDSRYMLLGPDIESNSLSDIIGIGLQKKLKNQPIIPDICTYENSYDNGKKYGYLYTWEAAKASCPPGWHLPSDLEWTILFDYLGGTDVAGGKLKETGTTHWDSRNTGATNETGFTALPGGYRGNTGRTFHMIGAGGSWWSATESNATYAWVRHIYYDDEIVRNSNEKKLGLSVRCVRDN